MSQIGIYLAGPIFGRDDDGAGAWRQAARLQLSDIYRICDPMQRDFRGREQQHVREIVEGDKRDIDGCRVVLVYYDKPSIGTAMEVLHAFIRHIQVHVVNASGKPISPWLEYHATKIHATLQDACTFLRGRA
jgi:nucleoside 2-deoxyribosyltransferase